MTTRTQAGTLAVALILGGAACGGDDGAAPPTTQTPAPPQAAPPPAAAEPSAPPPAQPRPRAKPKPKVRTIRVFVEQGRPRGGIQRPVVKQGARVRIVIRTDAGVEVHLHGYDITRPVKPGQPTQLAFRADIPGRFELELHHPDAVLADLEVRP